jgi:hypothetical protein
MLTNANIISLRNPKIEEHILEIKNYILLV